MPERAARVFLEVVTLARITEVDALRGVAILMMVAYHVIFDLYYFDILDISLRSLPLVLFQRSIGTLFLLLVGVSLTLSEAGSRDGYARHAKRALKLGAVALLITAVTWVYPHKMFIKFGIIHMIALSTLVAPAFFRFGKLNVALGLVAIAAGLAIAGTTVDVPYLFWLGLTDSHYESLDHYPMLPWFGIVLIGVYAGQAVFPAGKSQFSVRGRAVDALAFMGRHSLAIYLLHQPLLVAAALLLRG